MTSYLSENKAENLQNGNVHLAQIPDFEIGYLENHLAVRARYSAFLTLFHLSSTFFRPEFPFKVQTGRKEQVISYLANIANLNNPRWEKKKFSE